LQWCDFPERYGAQYNLLSSRLPLEQGWNLANDHDGWANGRASPSQGDDDGLGSGVANQIEVRMMSSSEAAWSGFTPGRCALLK